MPRKFYYLRVTLFFIGMASSCRVAVSQCVGGNCTDGWGTYIWSSGGEYTGQWVNGSRTGMGCYDWEDGSFYYGFFAQGKLEGDGIFLGTDESKDLFGRFYDGTLAESKTFASSGCIIGNCVDGVGVYLWETNDMFLGEWVAGNRTGYGRYDWADGSYYRGYFREVSLDGEGTYIGADNKKIEGLFVNNIFQQKTTAPGSYQPVIAYSGEVKETDICTMVQAAINDFPNNFENLKGNKHPDDGWSLGDAWDANIKVSGSSESTVSGGLLGTHNTWYGVLYEGTDYNEARTRYDNLISQMGTCKSGCCSFVSDKHDYVGDSHKSYLTYWMTFLVNDGFSSSYEDMVIEFELVSTLAQEGWEIVARAKEFKE